MEAGFAVLIRHFSGAVIAGDVSDFIGRRPTIISGSSHARFLESGKGTDGYSLLKGAIIYMLGVILQIAYHGQIGLIIVGRLISGVGVGFVSASEFSVEPTLGSKLTKLFT